MAVAYGKLFVAEYRDRNGSKLHVGDDVLRAAVSGRVPYIEERTVVKIDDKGVYLNSESTRPPTRLIYPDRLHIL